MERRRHDLLLLVMCAVLVYVAQVYGARNVSITLLETAVAKGAVCLDGSPPAYAYLKGSGDGVNNWVVYIQGGGWCISKHDCFIRSTSYTGSSSHILTYNNHQFYFDGILDDNATFNPQFYNWNFFYIFYCDGSSFMSDIEEVDPEHNITYRGARIFDAMVEDLFLHKGIAKADNVILTGTSAGGLATILHCDKFGALFPHTTKVKCVSDSGFFIHGEDLIGVDWREERFFNVVSVHGLANSLPKSCTTKMNPALCLFPENLVKDIKTPLFLVESAFDKYQIQNLIPKTVEWDNCTNDNNNLAVCNWDEIKIMKDFRGTFIQTLKSTTTSDGNSSSSSRGYFVHSCYLHGHFDRKREWTCSSLVGNNVLANKSIGEAVSEWYLNESIFQEIDLQNDLPRICSSGGLRETVFDQKCTETLRHA